MKIEWFWLHMSLWNAPAWSFNLNAAETSLTSLTFLPTPHPLLFALFS